MIAATEAGKTGYCGRKLEGKKKKKKKVTLAEHTPQPQVRQ